MHLHWEAAECPSKAGKEQQNLSADWEKLLCSLRRKAQTDFENLPHFYQTNTENRPKLPPIMGNLNA